MTAARDRPLLFSAPMVRAILDGRKTQTRRALSRDWSVLGSSWKSRKHDDIWRALRFDEAMSAGHKLRVPWCHPSDEPTPTDECAIYALYPPWNIGDRAWVRETWGWSGLASMPPSPKHSQFLEYAASGVRTGRERFPNLDPAPEALPPKWRSPIHMPRWASRITLLIEDVRVQRLQDISEEDARAEGMIFTDFGSTAPTGRASIDGGKTFHPLKPQPCPGWHHGQADHPDQCLGSARMAFASLWNSIHGPDAWKANPWVAALSFRAIRANIDATTPSGERG